MKNRLVLLCAVLVTACTRPTETVPTITPESQVADASVPSLEVSLAASSLMYGTQTTVHVRVENPGSDDWDSYELTLGYAPEGDLDMYVISDLPLSLPAGQVFEQDLPWTVDFEPDPTTGYQVRLMLLTSDGTSLAETAVPVAFVEPAVAISVVPVELGQGSQATVSVQVSNPSGVDMEGLTLLVAYGAEGGTSLFPIQEIPLSLPAGETFSRDIPWTVDYVPPAGSHEVSATLLLPGMEVWVSAATPVTLSAP